MIQRRRWIISSCSRVKVIPVRFMISVHVAPACRRRQTRAQPKQEVRPMLYKRLQQLSFCREPFGINDLALDAISLSTPIFETCLLPKKPELVSRIQNPAKVRLPDLRWIFVFHKPQFGPDLLRVKVRLSLAS